MYKVSHIPLSTGAGKKGLIGLLGIILLGIILYWGVLDAPFVFDDHHTIVENETIKNLPAALGQIRSNRYLTLVTFSLNYAAAGLNPWSYHLTNNMIHLINALLVYLFVTLIFKTPVMKGTRLSKGFIAFSASLIFIAHPVQTQAVTYITQRFALMATLFYILSIVFFIKARLEIIERRSFASRRHLTYYLLCIFSSVLAMKSKEIAITLPIMIILFEGLFIRAKDTRTRKFIYFLPIFLTILVIPLSLLDLKKPVTGIVSDVGLITMVGEDTLSRVHYLFTEFRVIVTYLRLLVLPVNQNLYYDYPVYKTLLAPGVLLSLLLLTGLVVSAVFLRKRAPLAAFGVFWFFITLSVESSIIPIRHVIFEHRLYLPSVGFFIAAAAVTDQLLPRKALKTLLIALIIVLLSFATYSRNNLWKDPVALWKDTVDKSPLSADPHNALGAVYMEAGLFKDAISEFEKALELKPDSATALYNLGNIYLESGLTDKAVENYLKALDHKSHHAAQIHNGLGLAYKAGGDYKEAIRQFKSAVAVNPAYRLAYYNAANTYSKMEDFHEAVEYYEKALELGYDRTLLPDIYNNMGLALGRKGDNARAIEIFEKAIRLFPGYLPYYANLGNEYMKKNDLDMAIDVFSRGLLVREEWYLYANLSHAYAKKGEEEKSRLARQKADMLKGN
ncbi:MAG TPA: tetratricopeptide repeat protein [Nitrospirae bacterium]|nr:tetratricopeptide repeat protein [Nitrospirota bacterium]